MNILEARQKDSNTISRSNGDYETILQGDAIVLEQGDTLEMSEAFIDTTETAAQRIFIEKDIEVKISYVMYKVLSDTNIPKNGVDLFRLTSGPGFGTGTTKNPMTPTGMNFKYFGVKPESRPPAGTPATYKQPLSSPDAPAILGQMVVPDIIDKLICEVTELEFRFINSKKSIEEFTMLIEYTDCRGVVSALPIRIPKQNARSLAEGEIGTIKLSDCNMGNGFRCNNFGSFGVAGGTGRFKVLNPQTLVDNNFFYVSTLITQIPQQEKHFVPVRRRFTFNLPAGKYSPDDIAQIITRETQQIRNSTTNRTYLPSATVIQGGNGGYDPATESYLLTPTLQRSGQNYNPEDNADPSAFGEDTRFTTKGAYLGPHFYTNSLYFPPINYGAVIETAPTANELTGLIDRYGFLYDATDFRAPNEYINPVQLMVTQSCVEAVPPGDRFLLPTSQTDGRPPLIQNWPRQVYFGSSQGIVMSFDALTNRFQIDNLHSPFYLQEAVNIGKIGWKYCAELVLTEQLSAGGDSRPAFERATPATDPIGIQGSLGGVMITGLEPFDFWEKTLGFSIHDVCASLSFRSEATEFTSVKPDNLPSSLNIQNLSQLLIVPDNVADTTAPKMFYLVNDNKNFDPPFPIGGLSTIRNTYQGRKITSCFLDKTSSIKFNIVATPTKQFPDANYEQNYPPTVSDWDGTYNGLVYAGATAPTADIGALYMMNMNSFTPATEQEATATTYIRAKNFAEGTTLTSAYFLVEVAGLFQNSFIGGTSYNKMICGILNRYYSTGQYTSGSTPFTYTHLGKEPLHLKSLRIRILTPDGKLATTIGEDNTVIITHRKSGRRLMMENLSVIDENSSKKEIEDREKLLKELSK